MPDAAASHRAQAGANLVCFELAGRRFGCPIDEVKETIAVKPITRVFLTPSWIAGIINLRGDIVAVVDLAAFLSLGRTAIGGETRILIVHGSERSAGVLVDRMAEVRAVDLAALEPPPATIEAEIAALLAGVVTLPDGGPLAVIDLARLLGSPRLRARPS